ncbi:hypothetical protein BUY75_02485 [Staphylococcus epidermidis]|uniref:hypothetical protein n=1 Tax=Staphylococcus epidermidis TaxID=1282 RepID=UPI000D1CA822|nr:hypothetical protein [Staphylococcus epidermidis]PTE46828.1 hypothetical protein BUY75_02485 [Staphylococcus epidermidis]
MKKSAHGLKIDGRKNLATNLEDNGLEKIKSENSGFVRLKKRKIEKLKNQEGTETEIAKLQKQIDEYLNN